MITFIFEIEMTDIESRLNKIENFIFYIVSMKLRSYDKMVPEVGLEPTQGCPYQILSLARLPVSPLGLN